VGIKLQVLYIIDYVSPGSLLIVKWLAVVPARRMAGRCIIAFKVYTTKNKYDT
jgi:hypothetical protein